MRSGGVVPASFCSMPKGLGTQRIYPFAPVAPGIIDMLWNPHYCNAITSLKE